jgi:hypothetical protein
LSGVTVVFLKVEFNTEGAEFTEKMEEQERGKM